eukprot:gnl/Trimastix_PCT/1812.p1 GENE.gnl/Trimastix_PCT/1812~~gnl/Trimastix_PCT/1812.p1  ORF type:complete len:203 (+),score=28.55 gnl/Trimastix_PCT/1812:24-632(+)
MEWPSAFPEFSSPLEARTEFDRLKLNEAALRQQNEVLKRRDLALRYRTQGLRREMLRVHSQARMCRNPISVSDIPLLMDPAVHAEIERLNSELNATRRALRAAQDDLDASHCLSLGSRLVNKCRVLQKENEQLGALVSDGHARRLESELIAQRQYAADLRKRLQESGVVVAQLTGQLEEAHDALFRHRDTELAAMADRPVPR